MNVLRQKKSKNIGYAPIAIEQVLIHNLDAKHSDLREFIKSISSAEQLGLLKNIVIKQDDSMDPVVTEFLATVYFYSPPKHPIKCFLIKHITKSENIQDSFSNSLSEQISSQLKSTEYEQYLATVTKTVLCIENFPAGVVAIKLIDVQLAEYLTRCLTCCTLLLKNLSLSPTKKHEIFNLEHSCLRLLVHIIQKLNMEEYNQEWSSLFEDFNRNIEQLIDDDDLPMDTKCLCGILYLFMEVLTCEGDQYTTTVTKLLTATGDEKPYHILKSRAGRLAVYSALATSVPVEYLQHNVAGDEAIILLTDKLLNISKSGSCQAIEVGVARALVQISRGLCSLRAEAGSCVARALHEAFLLRLDDQLDCVRHLAGTGLEAVVGYYVQLDAKGDGRGLRGLRAVLESVRTQPRVSRARWKAARCVTRLLPPAALLATVCAIDDIIHALALPHLYTTVRAVLTTVMSRHSRECSTDELFAAWVLPALACRSSAALDLMLQVQPDLADKLKEYMSEVDGDVATLPTSLRAGKPWGCYTSSRNLYADAVHPDEQVRIQSLSQVVETAKTAPFTDDDVSFILHFLKYNMNAHSPHFRQQVIALITKALERAVRTKSASLPRRLRAVCVSGAALACATRRALALALLLRAHTAAHTTVVWSEADVEILLKTLEDSYETNQAAALTVLEDCPKELLQKNIYSTSLDLEHILEQATSLKPADSLAAAYKLRLLLSKMPDRILEGNDGASSSAAYMLCTRLHSAVHRQARAAFAPLHCLSVVLHTVDENTLRKEPQWLCLVQEIISTCEAVNSAAAAVVNCASPEGYLPTAGQDVQHNNGVIVSEDGRPLTAQMVLLCAWRSVKEACLLLGWLGGVLSVDGGDGDGWGVVVRGVGDSLVRVVRGCQHRGGFEQAAAGLGVLLNRISSNEELSNLPKQYLKELLDHVSSAGETELQTTRRSAGLPFLIQTLLSSDPESTGHVTRTLLRAATAPGLAGRRALALNILCALFKSSSLESSTHPLVCDALHAAVCGVDALNWSERTAACLVFGALCVRAFGVARSRTSLDVRNTLPAHVFFIRYPTMYDLMLSKLEQALQSDSEMARPSVYPILLLLGRLRPSVDGTVSNLKVSPLERCVSKCAGSRVLKTRQLAARAAAALLAPDRYVEDIKQTLTILSSQAVTTNYCHGLLLRLSWVLRALGEGGHVGGGGVDVTPTTWILMHPCYLLVQEYVNVLGMMMERFPESISKELKSSISRRLEQLVFGGSSSAPLAARGTALAACCALLRDVTHQRARAAVPAQCLRALQHDCYEVVLETLNYILHVHKHDDQNNVLATLRTCPLYVDVLRRGYYGTKYPECRRKCLMLLILQTDTQKHVVNDMNATDQQIIDKLLLIIENSHIYEKHMFLKSLLDFISEKLDTDFDKTYILRVIRSAFASCLEENADDVRETVLDFLDGNITRIWNVDLGNLNNEDKFEYKASILALLVLLLEDDDEDTRQRASDVTGTLLRDVTTCRDTGDVTHRVLPSYCGEMLRSFVRKLEDNTALFVMIALLEFKCDACGTDNISEECRVFEHSDRSDMYLEDALWTDACADKIIDNHPQQRNLIDFTTSIITNPKYSKALRNLCKKNVQLFIEVANGKRFTKKDAINPKIELFVNKLRSQ